MFSPQTIAAATQAMIDMGLDYPPDLPVFKKLCFDNQVRPEQRPAIEYNDKADVAAAQQYVEKAKATIKRERDPLLDEPIQDGIVGVIQRVYAKEDAKRGKPNKQWACKHLLRYAGGDHMRAQQLEMSAQALKLTADQVDELRSIRAEVQSVKRAA